MAPRSCVQSPHITGTCDICNQRAGEMHLPSHPRGIFCDEHCPVCRMLARSPQPPALRRTAEPSPTRAPGYNSRTARVLAAGFAQNFRRDSL